MISGAQSLIEMPAYYLHNTALIPAMRSRSVLAEFLISFLFVFGLINWLRCQEASHQETILNPQGWNLPDKSRLELSKDEKVALPGVSAEISVEEWTAKLGSHYSIMNLPKWRREWLDSNAPRREEVLGVKTYKAPDGRALCYEYWCLIDYAHKRSVKGPEPHTGDAVVSLICDLDDDGLCESQFVITLDSEKDKKLLASILMVKLGLSAETELVRRSVASAVRSARKTSTGNR